MSIAIAWAVISLLFFLLFSATPPGQDRPSWYAVITYLLEGGAYLGAAVLCFRNWRSPQIVSGRNVWLAIGLGMLSYFIGNLIFGIWELVWQLDPSVSLADLFFLAAYVCLAWGMVQAVLPRRLSLELYQWLIVAIVMLIGIAIAVFIWFGAGSAAAENESSATAPPAAEIAPALNGTAAPIPPAAPGVEPPPSTPVEPVPPATEAIASNNAPGWVLALDEVLLPLETVVGFVYVVADLALLGTATTLLLAFWGGRFSQSWRMIAAAALSLYIADMWFLYATESQGEAYQSGGLPEVFWIFSGVLFAIGAALEYGVSSRSRRGAGRRRA